MSLPTPEQYRIINGFNEQIPGATSKAILVPVRAVFEESQERIEFLIDLTQFTDQKKINQFQGLMGSIYFVDPDEITAAGIPLADIRSYNVTLEFESGYRMVIPPDTTENIGGIEFARNIITNNPTRIKVVVTQIAPDSGFQRVNMDLHFTNFKVEPYSNPIPICVGGGGEGILGTEETGGAGTWPASADRAWFSVWEMTEDGLANRIVINLLPSDAGGPVGLKGIIYDNAGNQIAVGTQITVPANFVGGPVESVFAGEALVNGTQYKIGFVCNSFEVNADGGPPGLTERYEGFSFNAPPATIGAPDGTNANTVAAYVVYDK